MSLATRLNDLGVSVGAEFKNAKTKLELIRHHLGDFTHDGVTYNLSLADLETNLGNTFAGVTFSLLSAVSALQSIVPDMLRKTDGTAQTVSNAVNFTGTTQIAGATIATTSGTQTLTNKTLSIPSFNGWRQTSSNITATATLQTGASVYLVTTVNPVTLTLPAVTAGLMITVKATTASAPAITIQRAGTTATIDGATSVSITNSYGYLTLYSTSNNWFIIGKG